METNSIINIWKQGKESTKPAGQLTKESIQEIISGKSEDVYSALQKSSWIYFWIKVLVLAGLILLVISFQLEARVILLAGFIFISLIALIGYDMYILNQVKKCRSFSETISDHLIRLTRIFNSKLSIYKVIVPFYNSLFVMTGMIHYHLYKYGSFQLKDWDDHLVFWVVIIVAYVVGFIGSSHSMKEIQRSVKAYTEVLEDKDEPWSILEKENRRKIRNRIIAAVIAIVGIVLFIVLAVF